ncbi:MAG: hypothetical protein ACI9R3_005495 [Verrucomicrobiales bacterium]|jgi:hypothetical protein
MNTLRKLSFWPLLLLLGSCDVREQRREVFDVDYWLEEALGAPVPGSISKIEGVGDTWQGHSCFFRANCNSKEFMGFLKQQNFSRVDGNQGRHAEHFSLFSGMEQYFSEPWNPELNGKGIVLFSSRDYGGGAGTLVLIDTTNNITHIYCGAA